MRSGFSYAACLRKIRQKKKEGQGPLSLFKFILLLNSRPEEVFKAERAVNYVLEGGAGEV